MSSFLRPFLLNHLPLPALARSTPLRFIVIHSTWIRPEEIDWTTESVIQKWLLRANQYTRYGSKKGGPQPGECEGKIPALAELAVGDGTWPINREDLRADGEENNKSGEGCGVVRPE